jgi:monofunctional biosynthetic peptidoglycan transglycosylase
MERVRRGLWGSALLVVGSVTILTALPLAWLARRPPVGSAFMLRSRFADPASGEACAQVQYHWVDWHQISPFVPQAVVLAEDQRFLEHDGFDFRSIERALRSRESDARVRGASSITQQLAKNLFLWPGRSWVRKGVEAWYTGWMELAWSKRRILELYLNVAQFGPCVFGVEAAAGRYFDARALQLTREQAALLAAVLPNPARLRAHDPGPYLKQRTSEILELLDTKRDASWLRRL